MPSFRCTIVKEKRFVSTVEADSPDGVRTELAETWAKAGEKDITYRCIDVIKAPEHCVPGEDGGSCMPLRCPRCQSYPAVAMIENTTAWEVQCTCSRPFTPQIRETAMEATVAIKAWNLRVYNWSKS